jgi:hypothetical protein
MKFDQIMEKVEVNHIDDMSIYQSLIFNMDKESKIEYSNGNKYWLLNGKFHRADGPAIEYLNGYKYWYLNGKRHRTDGPACEYPDGHKSWWIHGTEFFEKEWK